MPSSSLRAKTSKRKSLAAPSRSPSSKKKRTSRSSPPSSTATSTASANATFAPTPTTSPRKFPLSSASFPSKRSLFLPSTISLSFARDSRSRIQWLRWPLKERKYSKSYVTSLQDNRYTILLWSRRCPRRRRANCASWQWEANDDDVLSIYLEGQSL